MTPPFLFVMIGEFQYSLSQTRDFKMSKPFSNELKKFMRDRMNEITDRVSKQIELIRSIKQNPEISQTLDKEQCISLLYLAAIPGLTGRESLSDLRHLTSHSFAEINLDDLIFLLLDQNDPSKDSS